MPDKVNKTQQEAIKEYLLNINKRQNANLLFSRFIERVNMNEVRNDGILFEEREFCESAEYETGNDAGCDCDEHAVGTV